MRPRLVGLVLLVAGAVACDSLPQAGEGAAPVTTSSRPSTTAGEIGSSRAGATSQGDGPAVDAPAEPETSLRPGGKRAVEGRHGMVVSEDEHVTRIGVQVLEAGGNAVDAAVAMGYGLSVTHHSAGSLGGGGFMLVRLADGTTQAIDFREVAPAKATVALNEKQLSRGAHGYLSAPVPGVVAGLNLAREGFGTRPLAELVAPAIALAKEGHPYGKRQATVLAWYWQRVRKDRVLRAIFGRGQGRQDPIGEGVRLVQPRLAETLTAIAERGNAGFYEGAVAARIAKAMKHHGGLVTEADLAAYRPKLRQPLKITYRGFTVLTMPPPSMGGVAVVGILLSLAQVEAHQRPAGSAESLHLFIESARRAYADRRAIGADPDFVDQGVVAPLRKRLLDPAYYASRQPPIDPGKATPSSAITPIHPAVSDQPESRDTTHFAVVDRQGNAVACTMTLSAAFGAWVVVPETGVLLSNAMGGFSPTGVNVLQPGKRMASSMSPTLLIAGGKTVAVLGSPGGDTIPNTVAQVAHHLIDHGMTIDEAVAAGRIHHQFKPDVVRLEQKRPPSHQVKRALQALGHTLKASPIPIGDANGIVIDPKDGTAWGYADDRKGGLAQAPSGPK